MSLLLECLALEEGICTLLRYSYPATHPGLTSVWCAERPQDVGTNGRASTIFLPHSPGTVSDVSAQLRTGFLSAMAAQEQQHMTR